MIIGKLDLYGTFRWVKFRQAKAMKYRNDELYKVKQSLQ